MLEEEEPKYLDIFMRDKIYKGFEFLFCLVNQNGSKFVIY
jgi:hypothetical protein